MIIVADEETTGLLRTGFFLSWTFENRWADQISAAATFTGKQTELSVNERKQRMEDE